MNKEEAYRKMCEDMEKDRLKDRRVAIAIFIIVMISLILISIFG